MRYFSSLIRLVGIFCVLASPAVLTAQTYFQPIDFLPSNIQLWSLDTVGNHDSAEDAVKASAKRRNIDAARLSPVQVTQRLSLLARYQPSVSRRQVNISKFLDRVRAGNPASANGLEPQLRGSAAFAAIDRSIAPYGMSTSNVADAFAVWWINSWEASHGILDSRSDSKTAMAVRTQALLAILSIKDFDKYSDAKKQEIADEYILNAALVSASMAYLAEHREQVPAFRKVVAKATRASGLDLESMTLTQGGFVQKKMR